MLRLAIHCSQHSPIHIQRFERVLSKYIIGKMSCEKMSEMFPTWMAVGLWLSEEAVWPTVVLLRCRVRALVGRVSYNQANAEIVINLEARLWFGSIKRPQQYQF